MTARRLLKITGLGITAVVGLLLLALAAIEVLVDPNDFRSDITAALQTATGRSVKIEGELGLSVFPWLGLRLGDTRLGNASAFVAAGGEPDFARVAAVDIRVKLLPLLQQRLVMKTLHLRGLRVNLQRDAEGHTNWDDLVAAAPTEAASVPSADVTPPGTPGPALAFAVGGVDVTDAQLQWEDRQTGQRLKVSGLSLRTGAIAPGMPIDISLQAQLEMAQPALQTPIKFRGRVVPNLQNQHYGLQGLDLAVTLHGTDVPGSPLALRLTGNVEADLLRRELEIYGMQLRALGATFAMQANVQLQTEQVEGHLSVAPFSPRELGRKLGAALPKTADSQVLKQAALELDLAATPRSLKLTNITVQLDDSHLNGSLTVQNFSRPALRCDLQLDDIDVDRYLPPAVTPPTPLAVASSPAAESLPLEQLRSLDINGDVRVAKLKVANAKIAALQLGLRAKDGVIRLSPLRAQLYQGNVQGNAVLDVRSAIPKVSVEEKLEAVHIGPLLMDVLAEEKFTGVATLSARLAAEGSTVEAVTQTLNGTAQFSFVNGAVKGFNLGQLLREAYAKLKNKPVPPKVVRQTDFAELKGSVRIVDGVVHNQDLRASSPALRVAGKGKVDLRSRRIDYLMNTSIVETDQGQGGLDVSELKALTIPVKITGSFDEPKFKLDLAPVLKAKASKKLQKAKARLKSKAKQKLEKKKAEAKEKLEGQLKDKLKGLFR